MQIRWVLTAQTRKLASQFRTVPISIHDCVGYGGYELGMVSDRLDVARRKYGWCKLRERGFGSWADNGDVRLVMTG
jgi:hypothetical protein